MQRSDSRLRLPSKPPAGPVLSNRSYLALVLCSLKLWPLLVYLLRWLWAPAVVYAVWLALGPTLGKTDDELLQTMRDMREQDIDMLTVGQYLQPTEHHLPVLRYVHPDVFATYERACRRAFRWSFLGAKILRRAVESKALDVAASVFSQHAVRKTLLRDS